MKFIISRSSDKKYDGKPCKTAFEVGILKSFGEKIYAIEFTTLEELMKFKQAMGKESPLVIYNSRYYPEIDIKHEIVIHDKGYID